MKRVQYLHYGATEELRLDEVPPPDAGQGQIRVQVRAAAANPTDWKIRRGEMKAVSGFRAAWAMISLAWLKPSGRGWNGSRWAMKSSASPPSVKRARLPNTSPQTKKRMAQAAVHLIRAGGRLDRSERDGLERAGGEGKAASWQVGLYHRVFGRGWTFGGADCAHARRKHPRQLQRVRT